ncbi:MAG: hypothetical protein ABIK28_17290 [Planctomycetota bacterium]
MPQSAWGIDIGDGTLKAVRLKKENRGFRVVQAVEIPYHDPFAKKKTVPPAMNRRTVAALRQLRETVLLGDLDLVAVGFPSFQALEGVLEIPRVDEQKQHDLIQYEIASKFALDLQKLKIWYKILRVKSADMQEVMAFSVRDNEFQVFLSCLKDAGIPHDRIVSCSSGLVDITHLCQHGNQQTLVLSPGFSATHMVLMQNKEFWSRTLPLGFPGSQGENIEVARNKIQSYCHVLKKEATVFALSSLAGESYNPVKVFVTGEGARVPSFINALDSTLEIPVEVLRPASRISLSSSGRKDMPPKDTVYSMGKAMGLAVGALVESRSACLLSGSPPSRRAMRKLPALSGICGILLCLIIGFFVIEWDRGRRLGGMEDALRAVQPDYPVKELGDLQDNITTLSEEVKELNRVHKEREFLLNVGKLLTRLEGRSIKGSFGDYHLQSLTMGFTESLPFSATVATRRDASQETLDELKAFFPSTSRAPDLNGPLPAQEETPPEGMSPLVLFEIKGSLR